jgi:hypothetical protein
MDDAHATIEVDLSETVRLDRIHMMQHCDGITHFVNEDMMRCHQMRSYDFGRHSLRDFEVLHPEVPFTRNKLISRNFGVVTMCLSKRDRDLELVEKFCPRDATTNPSLRPKSAHQERQRCVMENALGKSKNSRNNGWARILKNRSPIIIRNGNDG